MKRGQTTLGPTSKSQVRLSEGFPRLLVLTFGLKAFTAGHIRHTTKPHRLAAEDTATTRYIPCPLSKGGRLTGVEPSFPGLASAVHGIV
jgi:hypothetical protein